MRKFAAFFVGVALALGIVSVPSVAQAVDYGPGELTKEIPAAGTPNVLDGKVNSIIQVGNTIIVGGTFSQVSNYGSTDILSRPRLFAMDATTHQVLPNFNPAPNNDVEVVYSSGDGQTIYVGGTFTTLSGVSRSKLARIRISDGSV